MFYPKNLFGAKTKAATLYPMAWVLRTRIMPKTLPIFPISGGFKETRPSETTLAKKGYTFIVARVAG